MSAELAELPALATAHLQLALVALLLGAAVSLPLGIWAARRPRAERLVLGVASVVQTVPSLALLAIMVPALAALGALTAPALGVALPSIGFLPALVGLTLYSMLPILRNTVTGLATVDPALREAADGVGMTPRQRLRLVELPLALPVIVAGLRTATVWVVGIATLSTPVGAPSLGDYIFRGLQTRNLEAVLVGCVAAALLALALDALVHTVERGLGGRRPRLVAGALAVLALLYAYTGATLAGAWRGGGPRPIAIGAKTFTEQYVLAHVLGGAVARATGRPVTVVQSLGSTVAFDALAAGALDAYVDYSGTIWATIMKRSDVPEDPAAVLAAVSAYLAEAHGITLVGALGFENAYALAMRADHARRLGVGSISALAAHAPRLTIAGDYEFFGRPEWTALVERYGLAFGARRAMDPSLMYQAAAAAQVDVISAFTTDGRIAAFDLLLLEDDRHAIPPYDAIILARPGLAEEAPGVVAALAGLAGSIDAATMRAMNAAVDQEGRSPEAVARGFLDGR